MLPVLVKERLDRWMRYLDETNQVLYYTPYFRAVPAEPGSFNARHIESLFSINPLDVLSENYSHLVRLFEMNEEYICGFHIDSRPVAPDAFVAEMLLPDVGIKGVERRSKVPEYLEDNLHRNLNATMVMDCMRYITEVLFEDNTHTDYSQVLGAPCFLRNVSEIWQLGEGWKENMENAYLKDYIARSD